MLFEGLEFVPLREDHIDALTPVMRRAFDDDSRLFFGTPTGGPPGYDDGSFLRRWGLDPGASAYCIQRDGTPIGAMILYIDVAHRHGFLGNLFVDAPLIGQGYGRTAWRFAEQAYPDVTVWATETPAVSFRNHRFYINTCGFHVIAVEGTDRLTAQFKLRKSVG